MQVFEPSNPERIKSGFQSSEAVPQHAINPVSPGLGTSTLTDPATGMLPNPGRAGKFDLVSTRSLQQAGSVWRCFQQTAWHSPFQDFGWVKAWADTLPATRRIEPVIVFGYQQEKLVFILPLMRERVFACWRLTWLANEVNDLNAPLVAPDILNKIDEKTASQIWQYVVQCGGHVDTCHVLNQPSVLGDLPNPFILNKSTVNSCNSHILPLQKNWQQFYSQLRSAKSRSRLRQKENKLRLQGRLSFRSVRDRAARTKVIDQILKWKSDQLESRGDRNPYADSALDLFANRSLKQTIHRYAQSDAGLTGMRIYGLFLNGKLIAGIIAFAGRNRFSLLTTSYDPNVHPNCSPGLNLLVKSIQLAARAGFGRYDFLAGDEPYKFQWCQQHIKLYDSFSGATAIGQLHASADYLKYRLKKLFKSSPRTMSILRRVNQYRVKAMTRFDNLRIP